MQKADTVERQLRSTFYAHADLNTVYASNASLSKIHIKNNDL